MTKLDLRYPLHYPFGKPRTTQRQRSRFDPNGTRTFAAARDELLRQLKLLGAKDVILSTNIPLRGDGLPYARFKVPDDPGVAVYFKLADEDRVSACDHWDRVVDNVWAIAQDVDTRRAQLRWHVTTLSELYPVYALPDADALKPWWEVLEVEPTATWDEVKAMYRYFAKLHHPDVGGDRKRWDRIAAAYEQAEAALKGGDRS